MGAIEAVGVTALMLVVCIGASALVGLLISWLGGGR